MFAGKHTAIGECIGAAVYKATAEGIRTWQADFAALLARGDKQMAGRTSACPRLLALANFAGNG